MPKRSAIGPGALDALDPLDALLPEEPAAAGTRVAARPAAQEPPRRVAPRRAARPIRPPEPEGGPMRRLPVNLPADLIERARDAAYFTPGETLAGLVRAAVERELARRERERGEAFPRRGDRPLKRGRPIR